MTIVCVSGEAVGAVPAREFVQIFQGCSPRQRANAIGGTRGIVGARTTELIERENHMELGIIGLGRMGSNRVLRRQRGGRHCVVYGPYQEAAQTLAKEGAVAATSLEKFGAA
ncbi:MAG: NAD(P)-binding domain-containing protein [Acidobacteriaceae bacterium]